MRLIVVPPYQNPIMNWGFVLRELVAKLEKKGQLNGVEVDIDEGYLHRIIERFIEYSRAVYSIISDMGVFYITWVENSIKSKDVLERKAIKCGEWNCLFRRMGWFFNGLRPDRGSCIQGMERSFGMDKYWF